VAGQQDSRVTIDTPRTMTLTGCVSARRRCTDWTLHHSLLYQSSCSVPIYIGLSMTDNAPCDTAGL